MSKLSQQPFQLSLFKLTDTSYTNAFEFYESIPRFLAGGDRAKYIKPDGSIGTVKRNEDGTALPIEKIYEHRGSSYNLSIDPATIKQKNGSYKSIFPGIKEEIIEFIILKLSIEQGFFLDGENGNNSNTDNYTVLTSVYRIQEELKKRREKNHPSYSYVQILEAIEVLTKTNFTIQGESKKERYHFSPFVEFGYLEKDEDSSNKKKEEKNATIYIKLNTLIAKDILAKSWRKIGYVEVLQDDNYLSRWFRKTLSLKFTYADITRAFNIKLSTVINTSGISPYAQMRDNLAMVKKVLSKLDIVGTVKVEPHKEINPATNRMHLVDALLIIYPSRLFVSNAIASNSHAKKLQNALVGEDGNPLLEPSRRDFKTPQEYESARRIYQKALARK